jgi:hypothetical protein
MRRHEGTDSAHGVLAAPIPAFVFALPTFLRQVVGSVYPQTRVIAGLGGASGLEVVAGSSGGWMPCLTTSGATAWIYVAPEIRPSGLKAAGSVRDGSAEAICVAGVSSGEIGCLSDIGGMKWAAVKSASMASGRTRTR